MIDLDAISSEAEKNKELYSVLDERMEVDLAQFMQSIMFVLSIVRCPTQSGSPSLSLNLMMALVLGLIGGISLAFVIEFLDWHSQKQRRFGSHDGYAVARYCSRHSRRRDVGHHLKCQRRSLFTHANLALLWLRLRSVRTNVLFRTGNKKIRTLLITSAIERNPSLPQTWPLFLPCLDLVWFSLMRICVVQVSTVFWVVRWKSIRSVAASKRG